MMGARPTPPRGTTTGNFIAEWFGHRVWPTVDGTPLAVSNQSAGICPFLSSALEQPRKCIKTARGFEGPTGVCTISSDSNGQRQDWLACPHRTLDQPFTLLTAGVRTTYRIAPDARIILVPVSVLGHPAQQARIVEALRSKSARVFGFAGGKLGGEVDLPETDHSPGAKVDVSVIELTDVDEAGRPSQFGKHMFYEIQTADFHGSPLHAVRQLREHLPTTPGENYHAALSGMVEVAGTGVEGPNKANIFKRTIYQMVLKIQMAHHPDCAGFVIVLPVPVWDSWLRHLGRPHLEPVKGDTSCLHLVGPDESGGEILDSARAWVFVFDVDREAPASPHPLRIVHRVATSSAALIHYAFQSASQRAIEQGVIKRYRGVLEGRVLQGWKGGLAAEPESDE